MKVYCVKFQWIDSLWEEEEERETISLKISEQAYEKEFMQKYYER